MIRFFLAAIAPFAVAFVGHLTPAEAQATGNSDPWVDRAIAAYGGEALTSLATLRLRDDVIAIEGGSGYLPGSDHPEHSRRDLILDLEKNRASLEIFQASDSELYHARTTHTPDGVVWMNYGIGVFHDMDDEGYAAFHRIFRTSDVMLAYELAKAAGDASYVGETHFKGRPHRQIQFTIPQIDSPVTIDIDEATGLISRMTMMIAERPLAYYFNKHRASGPIMHAAEAAAYYGETLVAVFINRRATTEAVDESVFRLDARMRREPAIAPRDAMRVAEIGRGAHIVGEGYAYSMIVDAGDHLVAVDGAAGLEARMAAFRAETGNTKPLRDVVFILPDGQHVGGVADAVALGARLVAPASYRPMLEDALGGPLPDDRYVALNEDTQIDGVQLFNVSTPLASEFVLAFAPASGALFQARHYIALYEDEPWVPGEGAASLRNTALRLGLSPAWVLSGYGPKAESWADFERAIENRARFGCYDNRDICADIVNGISW